MKQSGRRGTSAVQGVAPRAGAWIETLRRRKRFIVCVVAPRAGAWIETSFSHPPARSPCVAPRAGAWIETLTGCVLLVRLIGRPPRGGVD